MALRLHSRQGLELTETQSETDLPAEQARAQAPARFPQAHGDGSRTPGRSQAAGQGPQAPLRLTRLPRRRVAHGQSKSDGTERPSAGPDDTPEAC